MVVEPRAARREGVRHAPIGYDRRALRPGPQMGGTARGPVLVGLGRSSRERRRVLSVLSQVVWKSPPAHYGPHVPGSSRDVVPFDGRRNRTDPIRVSLPPAAHLPPKGRRIAVAVGPRPRPPASVRVDTPVPGRGVLQRAAGVLDTEPHGGEKAGGVQGAANGRPPSGRRVVARAPAPQDSLSAPTAFPTSVEAGAEAALPARSTPRHNPAGATVRTDPVPQRICEGQLRAGAAAGGSSGRPVPP
jgi:hypothetical protein